VQSYFHPLRTALEPTTLDPQSETDGDMDFELDDDQTELRSTVCGIIDKECSPAFVRSVIDDGADPSGWWATMVELYWPALAIAEEHGGLGMTWVELSILLEELGRANDPSPFVGTTTQFVPIVAHAGDVAQQARWLSEVAAGTMTGALALGGDTVTVVETEGGWRLDGSVRHVVDGDRADVIAVVAEIDGDPAVFMVERDSTGLTTERAPAFDLLVHIADLTLDGVEVATDHRLGGIDVAGGIERAIAEATLGWAIPTVGASQRILDMTVEYAKERHQFGVPIGSFQGVKHKAVDMYVAVERARAVCQYAALVLAQSEPGRNDPGWPTAVSMAKAAAGDCQRVAIRNGIQLFGGIGFTWENDLQISVRRAKIGEVMFGSTGEHRRRIAKEALAS
jgi:alkylation response protein AidB-like acyl-CoA dehydrogenase